MNYERNTQERNFFIRDRNMKPVVNKFLIPLISICGIKIRELDTNREKVINVNE